jgi:hypothetical protein
MIVFRTILNAHQLVMKNTLAIVASTLVAFPALAGTSSSGKAPAPPVVAAPETPFISGSLNLTMETHFMSFGQDVWAAGNSWEDPLFHPSLELNFNLGGGFTGILGTWWDVNDNATSSIGNSIQEIDIWTGFSYSVDKWKTTVLYHDWMYASDHEQALELKVAYSDGFLNPYVLFHGRFDAGVTPDEGLVTVIGVGPTAALGPVSLSFPVQIAADTDNYHGGDAGISFVSAGVSASLPLSKQASISLGITYYHTFDDVIVTNPDDNIIVGSLGLGFTF